MKKLISILVIVAMLLASVLAMIPASAAKVSDTALATYNVNWKKLYDGGKMISQWWNDLTQNDYSKHFDVTVTTDGKQISSEAKLDSTDPSDVDPEEDIGDVRSYYSTDMFAITETTYYEYVFEAKNNDKNHGGYAGVIFAYKTTGDYKMPYFMYGAFQNDSDKGAKADLRLKFGHSDNNREGISNFVNTQVYPEVKPLDDDGNGNHFGRYKVVFDGFTVRFYYYAANDQFVEMFETDNCTLPEDAKVCFGVYSRDGTRNVVLRNCVLTAHNYETAAIMNGTLEDKGLLAATIDEALAMIASDKYVATTEDALNTAVEAAKLVLNNAEADANAIAEATAAFADVDLIEKATADDKAALQASLTTANALTEQPATATPDEWTAFGNAKTAAQTVYDNAEASKADVENAKAVLDAAYALATSAADTTALAAAIDAAKEKVEAGYTKASWDAFATKLAAAEGLDANADQDAVDDAEDELVSAMNALVPAAANLGALKTAYDAAALITEKPATATDPAWTAFTAARDAANALLTARSDDEDAVASATAALNGAKNLLAGKINVMGDSDADTQFAGTGNVFYYDYYKYITTKGYTVGQAFSMSGSDKGDANFMLRLGNNGGGGTASVCDGTKDDGPFSHQLGDIAINDVNYKHAFGYSFKERVTVDSVKFYLPTGTEITSIDVYGAVRSENGGTTVYGKDADKVFLGRFAVGAAEAGAANIVAGGDLSEAYSVDYIFFAVSGPTSAYKFYEIELFGILNGADYSALKDAIADANEKVQADYTPDTWTAFAAALTAANAANKNALSTQVEINFIVNTLNDAMASLAANPVDKTALAASIGAAEALKQADYVSTSWTTLAAPLAAAKAANESTEATQSDVNAAKAALDAAVAALVKRGDKTELKALIEEYKALKETDWNGNTTAWGMFLKGIEAAEALCENADASEADVAGMITDLKDRKAALQASENNGGAEGDEPTADPETPGTDAPAGDETDAPATDAPETEAPKADETEAKKGGCGSSIALSALAVIGVVGTALVIKKKED